MSMQTSTSDTQRASGRRAEWSRVIDPATYRAGVPHGLFAEMRVEGPVV